MQWASSGSYKLTKEISSKTFPGTHMQLFFVFSKATANLQTHTDTLDFGTGDVHVTNMKDPVASNLTYWVSVVI